MTTETDLKEHGPHGLVDGAVSVLVLLDHLLQGVEGRPVLGDGEEGDEVAAVGGSQGDGEQPPRGQEHPPAVFFWQLPTAWRTQTLRSVIPSLTRG